MSFWNYSINKRGKCPKTQRKKASLIITYQLFQFTKIKSKRKSEIDRAPTNENSKCSICKD